MAKKVSSWSQKSIYKILAPESFGFQEIGTTMAGDPKNLVGRTVNVSLRDLTNDKSKQNLKVIFEINDVQNNEAHTRFKILETNSSYLRSKIRKGVGKVDYISRLNLDNSNVKIKIISVTNPNIKTPQKKDIHGQISTILESHKGSKLDDFVQSALFGKLGTDLYHGIKKICPVRRVEIEQIKVIS